MPTELIDVKELRAAGSLVQRVQVYCDGLPDGKVATVRMLREALPQSTQLGNRVQDPALQRYRFKWLGKLYFGNRNTVAAMRRQFDPTYVTQTQPTRSARRSRPSPASSAEK